MPLDPARVLLRKAQDDGRLAALVVGDPTVADEQIGAMSGQADRQLTFDWGTPPDDGASQPAGPLPAVAILAARLHRLADHGVFLGTSSWKYPGWRGQVYDPGRYQVRGRFSERKFNDQCLSEYAHVFPTVCGDFAFYQFPSTATWERIFGQVPAGFRFSLKVPEEVTVERYPDLPRYGRRAGRTNAHFMDAALLKDQLLGRLAPHRDKLGAIVFQFGTFHAPPLSDVRAFTGKLDGLLTALPTGDYAFAVEVRNPAFLASAGYEDYLACLRTHGVAHCLNSWTHMPPVGEQLTMTGILTAPHVVARFLLRPGRTYQQAVDRFAPYERIQDPYPQGRDALRQLIDACIPAGRTLYGFVNNRFEGNAVQTLDEVTADFDAPSSPPRSPTTSAVKRKESNREGR